MTRINPSINLFLGAATTVVTISASFTIGNKVHVIHVFDLQPTIVTPNYLQRTLQTIGNIKRAVGQMGEICSIDEKRAKGYAPMKLCSFNS